MVWSDRYLLKVASAKDVTMGDNDELAGGWFLLRHDLWNLSFTFNYKLFSVYRFITTKNISFN